MTSNTIVNPANFTHPCYPYFGEKKKGFDYDMIKWIKEAINLKKFFGTNVIWSP